MTNHRMFKQLPRDEQIALFVAWLDGEVIQAWQEVNEFWLTKPKPAWQKDVRYRVIPIPLTKPSITENPDVIKLISITLQTFEKELIKLVESSKIA